MPKIPHWIDKIGARISTVATLLVTPWGLVLSAIAAIWAAWKASASAWAQDPQIQLVAMIFVFLLWTYIGLAVIWTRRSGMRVITVPDLEYGLGFECMSYAHDPNHEQYFYQVGISVRNTSRIAIRFRVKKLEIRLNTRTVKGAHGKNEKSLLVPFGLGRTYWAQSYPKSEVAEFVGKRTPCVIEAEIEYGSHNAEPSRILSIKMAGDLTIAEKTIEALRINEEEESAISTP